MSTWHKKVNWNVVIIFEILAIVMAILMATERRSAVACASEAPQEAVALAPVDVVEAVVVEQKSEEKVMKLAVVPDERKLAEVIPASWFNHNEIVDLVDACKKNGCWSKERLALVMAIRKAENGSAGFEYGCVNKRGMTYRDQAGACCATVNNFMIKRGYKSVSLTRIKALACKYSPNDVETWYPNVSYWYKKFLPLVGKVFDADSR